MKKEKPQLKIIEANEPKLDKATLKLLSIALVQSAIKFYENPENMRRFEEWQAQQESEKTKN